MPFTNYLPGVWNDFGQALNAAWPDITQWDRVTDAEKFDWEQLVRDGQLAFPYGIVLMGDMAEWDDGPADETYLIGPVAMFYIAQDDGTDKAAAIEAKINAMNSELLTDTFTTMQVFPGFSTDTGPDTQTAIRELSQKMPATSGRIVFQCLIPGPQV